MCGSFEQQPTFSLQQMLSVLQAQGEVKANANTNGLVLPSTTMQILIQVGDEHQLVNAIFGFKHTFKGEVRPKNIMNSKAENLESSRMWNGPYKTTRCIIPVNSFMESKEGKYHKVEVKDDALALGGLYRERETEEYGIVREATIITTAPTEAFSRIHKRMPVMLDYHNEDLMAAWLKQDSFPEGGFDLSSRIPKPLTATPSERYRTFIPFGEALTIA